MTHHAGISINQSDFGPEKLIEKIFISETSCNDFFSFYMFGFNFDHGGRRCIRPILEKYQSGKGRLGEIQIESFNDF